MRCDGPGKCESQLARTPAGSYNSRMASRIVHVRVPATSANLGPGFDALGMAIDLWLEAEVGIAPADGFEGKQEATELTAPGANLIHEAAAAVYAEVGLPRPPLLVKCSSEIPLARGLGSSAAAICAGILAADVLTGAALSPQRQLALAARIEGHPDNVAPALMGGITVAVGSRGQACALALPSDLHVGLGLVLAIPRFRLATVEARAVLPEQVRLQDAVYNVGRSALLVAALSSGRLDLLAEALGDRLHQPYREPLVPGMAQVVAAARCAGAHAVTLSGAGPALLAWCPRTAVEPVRLAMQGAWGDRASARSVELSRTGARAW